MRQKKRVFRLLGASEGGKLNIRRKLTEDKGHVSKVWCQLSLFFMAIKLAKKRVLMAILIFQEIWGLFR